jgi:MoaA/NifB/PqqE/SkfB family radical SAM enzyme
MATVLAHRQPLNLSLDDYREVMTRDFAGPTKVMFSGFAETLVHSAWHEFVAFEKQRGNGVLVATNGVLLNPPNRRRIVELGVDQLTVSLESLEPDSYEDHRPGGDFLRVRQNLLALRDDIRAARAPTEIVLNYVVSRSTASQILPFLRWMHSCGFASLALIRLMLPGVETDYYRTEGLSDEEYRAIDFDAVRRLANSLSIRVFWSSPDECGFRSCSLPFEGVYLSASLDVSVCPFGSFKRELVFGNLRDTPFRELWDRRDFAAFREGCRQGEFPEFCRDGCRCYFEGGR